MPLWELWFTFWDISSGFPSVNHFDLSGSKSLFGIYQDLPMCVYASLSQNEFYQNGVWVGHIPWHNCPFDLQGAFLHTCGLGDLLTSRISNRWSGKEPASSLYCPAIPIHRRWISNHFTLGKGHLPPALVPDNQCIPLCLCILFCII